MKSIYVETSVISYLTALPSRDLRDASWQEATHEWWRDQRPKYELFVSELVLIEARRGDPEAARRRLEAMADLPVLVMTDAVREFARRLMADGCMPPKAEADANHVAAAAVHNMDYLLTWNCRHIENAETIPLIRSVCAIAGYNCPEIMTPLAFLPPPEGFDDGE